MGQFSHVDGSIASPPDEHAPTCPLGDGVEEPCVDATDETSSSRMPDGPNKSQAPRAILSFEALFHLVMRRQSFHILTLVL